MSRSYRELTFVYLRKSDRGKPVEKYSILKTSILNLPVISIQKLVWFFPALFWALHPYWPAFPNVIRSIVSMLLLLPMFIPSLVQLTFSGWSPFTVQFIENEEFNGTDWFLSKSFSFGGTERDHEILENKWCHQYTFSQSYELLKISAIVFVYKR